MDGRGEINRTHLEHICPKALTLWVSSDMTQTSSRGQGQLSKAFDFFEPVASSVTLELGRTPNFGDTVKSRYTELFPPWGHNSMVEHLPRMNKVLGSIPGRSNKT